MSTAVYSHIADSYCWRYRAGNSNGLALVNNSALFPLNELGVINIGGAAITADGHAKSVTAMPMLVAQ